MYIEDNIISYIVDMIWMKVLRFISLGRACKITVVSRLFYLKILVTCGGACERKVIILVRMRNINLYCWETVCRSRVGEESDGDGVWVARTLLSPHCCWTGGSGGMEGTGGWLLWLNGNVRIFPLPPRNCWRNDLRLEKNNVRWKAELWAR